MGQILSFRPTDDQISAAWDAYEAARREADAMDHSLTTSAQRMHAEMEAIRRHRIFYRLCERLEAI